MFDRIASAALVVAAATAVYAQTDVAQKRDPFAISSGSTFSASTSTKRKIEASTSRTLAVSISTDVDEALSIIKQNYVDGRSTSVNDLAKSSINSMLKSLDPHSNFYDAAEYRELIGDQRSEYFGTGSTIISYIRDGKLETYVVATYPGSASDRAGLKFGDKIMAVNGISVEGKSSMEIRDLIRGPRNTSVRVTIERDGSPMILDLRRDRIPQPTVTNAFLMKDGVGLIEMPEGFSFTSYDEFNSAFNRLKQAGMTSLIFDLRGNGGGVLETSVKIAEKFLPTGSTILTQRGRVPIDNRVWKSANRSPERMPLVVLVDAETASASEVIAGALQDNDRALIVGEKTFGKGLVQSVLDLPGGTGLTLTTAKYFTPSGRSIQRDYERSGSYAYYHHQESEDGTKEAKVASYTVTKRQVFGGDGITPDEFAPSEEATEKRIAMLDPIFYFAKQNQGLTEVSDDTLVQFAQFAAKGWGLNESAVLDDAEFVRARLQYTLTLGRSGIAPAKQQMLTTDPQVAAAVRSISKAAAFVRTPKSHTVSTR
ncbi:MAG TPA: S41 family peptidase [Pyrinomonadaceae bacterium]|nr:S41 family peptidase [Pyrinomonadaceae bacterium]